MIVDLLLDLVGFIIDGIVLLLPQVAIPKWSDVMDAAPWVNQALYAYDGLLPISEVIEFYRWTLTVWAPGFIAYVSIRWVWSHVPMLGSKS